MQHHGDNMLALARALADAPELGDSGKNERALFFDVFGRAVVVLPGDLELPACGALILGWVAVCLLKRRTGVLRPARMLLGIAAIPAAVLLAGLVGAALSLGMFGVGRLPTPSPPDPVVHEACYSLGGLAAALSTVAFFGRRIDAWHVFAGTGAFLAVTGTAVAFVLPGSSYPFFVPSAVAWLGALLTRGHGLGLGGFVCLAGVAGAVALAPFFALLPSAIGMRNGSVHAALAAWGAMSLAVVWPALLGRRLVDTAAVSALAAAASIGLALLWPANDQHHPARANIVHVTLAGNAPCWFLDDADPLPLAASSRRRRPLPWEREGLCLTAPTLDLPPPQVETERRSIGRGRFVTRGSMRSLREAPWLVLCMPPSLEIERAELAGVEVDLNSPPGRGLARNDSDGWRSLAFLGAEPDEEIEFEVTYRGSSRLRPHVFDRTLGLPDEARALQKACARAQAAPIHAGDGVIVAAPTEAW